MKLLFSLLLTCVGLQAQLGNTVYQQIFFNNISSTAVSASVRNIGAQYQQLTVTVTQNPGSGTSCAGTYGGYDFIVGLQASVDNVTWFPIRGTTIVYAPINGVVYSSAPGAFPYVRGTINFNDTLGACQINAWYSGTLTGSPTSSAPATALNDNFAHTLFPMAGDLAASHIIFSCPVNSYAAIYSMTLTNLTGGAVTGYVSITNTSTPTTADALMWWTLNATAPVVIWPQAVRPWIFNIVDLTKRSAYLNIVAGGTPGQVWFEAAFRCE